MNRFFVLPMLFAALSSVQALEVQVGDIKDNRNTGKFFNELEIELKLLGDEVADAKAVRTAIVSAVDSTGRDIFDPEKAEAKFQPTGRFGNQSDSVTVKLKNPARKAEQIKEIKGKIELFMPSKDPQSVILLKSFKSATGKPLASPVLKSAGIEISMFTAAQAAEAKKLEAAKREKEMRAQGINEEMIKMAASFSGAFGGGDDNSVTINLKDPQSKLVNVEFLGADGKEIDSQGSMTSGDQIVKYFSSPVPDDAQVRVSVLTPQSVVSVPLNLANITLP